MNIANKPHLRFEVTPWAGTGRSRRLEGNLGEEPADRFHHDLKADFILASPPFSMSDWGGYRPREDVRWH